MVVKKGGRREPFDRTKLEEKIQLALRKRPLPQMKIEAAMNELEDQAEMIGKTSHEITSGQLGDLVLEKLYEMDRVAYIRFASVYRDFQDVDAFEAEIQGMHERRSS